MTNQEAIKILSKNTWANYLASQKDFNDAIQQAINTLTAMGKIRDEIAQNHDFYYTLENGEDIAKGLSYALNIVDDVIKEKQND